VDQNLKKIDLLEDFVQRSFQTRTLSFADETVRLLTEHQPRHSGLPRAYLDAAQICVANGDLARG
jgi:hypothetical protein